MGERSTTAGNDSLNLPRRPAARRFAVPFVYRFDVLLAGLLAVATFVVHDIGYMFSQPYWTDEGWVAIATRLPLTDLLQVSGSTPVGWSLLLRLVFAGGPERLRVVPLLFSVSTVVSAYVLGRSLPWRGLLVSRICAGLAATAVLLSRSSLLRGDLKQYTADAFVAVIVLCLVSRLEKEWTRRRLITLGVVAVAGFLLSSAAAFVAAAAFGSLLIVVLVRRQWSRAVETAIVGLGSGAALAVVFIVCYLPGRPPGLTDFWSAYYLPLQDGWAASWAFLRKGTTQLANFVGMGPLMVLVVLALTGTLTLSRLGRPGTALFAPVLLAEMLVLSGTRQYPLFDLRTSHFISMVIAVTAAIGVAGVTALLARTGPWLPALVAVLAVTLMVLNPDVRSVLRNHNIPAEDVRTPALYIAAHLQPGDVVVVNMLSNWAFAYYWPDGEPGFEPVTTNLPQFLATIASPPDVLMAADRTRVAIDEVIARAAAAAAARGPAGRIWFVHQHYVPSESAIYAAAIAAHRFHAIPVIRSSLDLLTPLP